MIMMNFVYKVCRSLARRGAVIGDTEINKIIKLKKICLQCNN